MTRTFNFKGVLAALLLTCCLQSAFSQTFWTETFIDQASSTTKWVHGGTNTGAQVWTWTDDPLAGFQNPAVPAFDAATASTGYFIFNSDANGNGNAHDVTLTGTGNPADCSGKNDVKLRFHSQYIFESAGASAQVGVSTDGANFTYHTLFAGLGALQIFQDEVEVDLDEADGKPQVWIQFRWIGNYEYHWKVDDLELTAAPGAVPCDQNPMAVICDNFETYTIGNVSPQATWWTPWNLTDASPVGSEVSADFASQGTQSMKVKPDGAPNGDDQLLLLGNKTTGRYSLKWKQYIQTGKSGYFNIQDSETPGVQYNGEYYFDLDSTGRVVDGTNPVITFIYPHDKWFPVEIIFDLDNNLAKIFVDGKVVRIYAYTGNIGSIDYYAAGANATFYVDEVEYVQLTPIVYNADECGGAVDISTLLGKAPNVPQTTGIYDNTTATVDTLNDPSAPSCFLDGISPTTPGDPTIDGSMWFTFTGDGGTYHIETVPCNSTDYIDDGDTQLAIYTGECGDLIPVAGGCNEDLAGADDFRAGLDFETENGVNYYMLIDGWSDPATAFVALGEYCIEITQKPSITCVEGAVGTYEINNNSYLCYGTNLNEILIPNVPSFVIPTIGPVFGMVWCITAQPVPANAWPGTIVSIASTVFNPEVIIVSLPNDGTSGLTAGEYYLTPVVLGGGTLIDPTGLARIFNVDPAGGCYFVGESKKFTLMPELTPFDATADVTQPTNPPGNNGSIDLTVTGGFYEIIQDPSAYTVEWTGPNGFISSEEDISGLEAGDYIAIITDITGCVDPYDFPVSVTTAVKDPASVKSLSINPNPTSNLTTLNLVLEQTADVRIEVLNTLGQALQTVDAGKVSTLNQQIDLSRFTDGTYFLRVTVDGETAIRRVVLNR